MTLLHLHQDDASSPAGMPASALRSLHAALRFVHHALVEARSRPFGEDDGGVGEPHRFFDCGAPSYPQQPLILGDKWDF